VEYRPGNAGSTNRRPARLRGEDEFLLGLALEQDLQAAGCVVIGPFRRLAQAQEAARRETFDLAILDINLAGEPVYPLAEELLARGTPFIFMSGYDTADMPERFRVIRRLPKPYDQAHLLQELRGLQARGGSE